MAYFYSFFIIVKFKQQFIFVISLTELDGVYKSEG